MGGGGWGGEPVWVGVRDVDGAYGAAVGAAGTLSGAGTPGPLGLTDPENAPQLGVIALTAAPPTPLPLDQLLYEAHEFGRLEGLGEESVDADVQPGIDLVRGTGADDGEGKITGAWIAAEAGGGTKSVKPGHHDIEGDHIGPHLMNDIQTLGTISRGHHLEALQLEIDPDQLPDDLVVVHNKHPTRRAWHNSRVGRHRPPRPAFPHFWPVRGMGAGAVTASGGTGFGSAGAWGACGTVWLRAGGGTNSACGAKGARRVGGMWAESGIGALKAALDARRNGTKVRTGTGRFGCVANNGQATQPHTRGPRTGQHGHRIPPMAPGTTPQNPFMNTLDQLVGFYPSPRTQRSRHAPVAQGIEQRPPEPCAQVRILPGAPCMRCPKTPSPVETLRTGSSRMCRRTPPKAAVCQ